MIHVTVDKDGAANWVFTPGVGATCTFQIYIPDSVRITANGVTYQAWETLPGNHTDVHRIETNVPENQKAHRGGMITITFGPTKTGTIDLQLYDDYADHTLEVAGMVTATCR